MPSKHASTRTVDPMQAVYAEVGLKHALQCGNPACQLESCKHLKVLLDHTVRCSKPKLSETEVSQSTINTSCDQCIEYWEIVKLHARHCRSEKCPVANCEPLRPSSMRKKLMSKKKSTGSSGASTKNGSNASMAGSKAGSFVSETGGSGTLKTKGSFIASPKKSSSFEDLDLVTGSGSASELPRVTSTPKGLKTTSSFISVGESNKQVPILAADEAFKGDYVEDKAHENVYNPMYADDEMGEIPQKPKAWWSCFGGF